MTARFATAPIGTGLAALDGGLTLTTLASATDPAAAARSDVAHSAGVHGAEFVAWGNADQVMAIGVLLASSSLEAMVGGAEGGIGWRLDSGEIWVDGAAVTSGLDVPAKGDIVGVRVDFGAGNVKFYAAGSVVHTQSLGAGTWHFAASLASAVPGELACAVNSGQWIPAGPAAAAGWEAAAAAPADVRLADIDYLAAASDTPAHARYEGVIGVAGIEAYSAMHFWPWGGSAPMQGGNAQVELFDAEGLLDTLAQGDIAGLPVEVRVGSLDGTLAASDAVGRYAGDHIEQIDDVRKTLHLRDAHDALDRPLTRGVFLPSLPALAWRPVPAAIGAVASVPAIAATVDGSVAFLCDTPLAECSAVLDRGDPLEDADWSLDPSGQQLLLANSPLGPVVADVSTIGIDMAPATLEQALRDVFGRAKIAGWSSADAAAIDAATGYAGIGFYAGDDISCRVALAALLPSYGAWFYRDGSGVIRIVRVIDPDTVDDGDLAFDLAAVDLSEDLQAVPDRAPNLTRRMAFRPNAKILGPSDLVTDLEDVPPQRRIELTSAYRGQVYSAVPMAARYRHADAAAPLVSCFWNAADAQAEIDRVCSLYAVPRFFYRWHEQGNTTLAPEPGQVGRITYPRYGLEAGRKVLVRDVQRNPVTGEVTMTLWGA